jgi:hypothetical protein
MSEPSPLDDLRRIKRVADQSCTAHARLRDRYSGWATILDTVVLCASAWVTALALVDPTFAVRLTPPWFSPPLWIGLLSIAVFIATLMQLKLDLRGRSDAHRRAFEAQTEIKHAANEAEQHPDDESRRAAVLAKVALSAGVGVSIPEDQFLRLKADHLRKVEVSRRLDKEPFAWLPWLRLQLWWRDNFRKMAPKVPEPGNRNEA